MKDHVCECCRIAAVFDEAGDLVLAWRDIMPGSVRDHAFSRITRDGQVLTPRRLTRDGWVIEACPHHGPALAAGRDGTVHAVWFTGESHSDLAPSTRGSIAMGRCARGRAGSARPSRASVMLRYMWMASEW